MVRISDSGVPLGKHTIKNAPGIELWVIQLPEAPHQHTHALLNNGKPVVVLMDSDCVLSPSDSLPGTIQVQVGRQVMFFKSLNAACKFAKFTAMNPDAVPMSEDQFIAEEGTKLLETIDPDFNKKERAYLESRGQTRFNSRTAPIK